MEGEVNVAYCHNDRQQFWHKICNHTDVDKLYRTFFGFMVMLLIIGIILVPDCAVFALPTLWDIVVDGYSFIHLIKEEVCMKLSNIKTTTTNSFTCGGAEASRCVAYSVVRCQVNVS